MDIDIRTLTLIVGIANIVQFIAVLVQYLISKTYKGVGWWLLGFALIAPAFIFYLFRDYISSPFVAILLPNILMIGGAVAQYVGVSRFVGRRENFWIIIPTSILFLSGYTYYTYFVNDINIRSVIFSLTAALFVLSIAVTLFRYKSPLIKESANFVAFVFFFHTIFLLFRTASLITFSPINNMFAPSTMQTILFVDAFVHGVLVTFGLIIMVNQRLSGDSKEAQEHFKSIFNAGPDASFITRMEDGYILDLNHRFILMFGYSRDEVLGKTTNNLGIWKSPQERAAIVGELDDRGYYENVEIEFKHRDGTSRVGLISGREIMLQGVPHVISVVHDITQRKQNEEELRELNATKDKFFSIIAHDLRSPFNALIGFSNLLITNFDGYEKSKVKDMIGKIHQVAFETDKLLNNLLEWSQVKRGLINPLIIQQPLKPLVESVCTLFAETANAKEIRIVNTVVDDTVAIFDASITNTILRNLLANAIKFTNPGGEVRIAANVFDSYIEISFKDTGIGIPLDKQNNLFSIANSFSTKGTANEKGTGLGLILCKELVEIQGGRIWLKSEVGVGTTFTFTLNC